MYLIGRGIANSRGGIIPGKRLLQVLKGFLRIINECEKLQVTLRDNSLIQHFIEVDHFLPIFRSINNDGHLLFYLVRLQKSEDLHQLIQRTKSSREDHESFCKIHKPEFSHEEIVKFKVELLHDERIGDLLKRQTDVHPDGLTLRQACS